MAMLFLAALLHAIVILGVTFTAGAKPKADDSPGLEVVLVTNDLPSASQNERATYLAQRTQLGSGNTVAAVAASSPATRAPPSGSPGVAGDADRQAANDGDTATLATSAAATDIRYFATTAQERSGASGEQNTADESDGPPVSGHGDAEVLTLRGRQRDGVWVSPDTRESMLAPYIATWKRKVERVGTLNFPESARNKHLSGNPVVEVTIRADGRLLAARVQRSSGQAAIDRAALSILKLASPFDPFPEDLAAKYRTLRFAYQWEFVGGALAGGAVTASSDAADRP